MRIVCAQINPTVGDLDGNTCLILEQIAKAQKEGADLVLFPEMCLSGYPVEDLLLYPEFLESVQSHLKHIIEASKGISVVLGLPRKNPAPGEKFHHNSAAIIFDGRLLGYHDKILIPTYDVFDELRYFEPGSEIKLWEVGGQKVGITICEDIWQHGQDLRYTSYKTDPILQLKKLKPDLVLNLSASPYSLNKPRIRASVAAKAVQTLQCPLLLCNQVGGNDSLIFDGNSLFFDGAGNLAHVGKGFSSDSFTIETDMSYPRFEWKYDMVGDLYQALVLGVRDYFYKQGFKKACIGLSGGVDSSLVASIAVEALGNENVLGVLMPSRFTSKASIDDAHALAKNLDIQTKTISIESPFQNYLDLLNPVFRDLPQDMTEENLQARIRGMILMALSNKLGYIVLSTGNKSETAVGYATLYGDMCGGLAVINDVTKEQVYALCRWINRRKNIIPQNVFEKAPSAELKLNQKDTDSLPDYSIVDSVLQDYIVDYQSPEAIVKKHGYAGEVVHRLVKMIHRNEYKRRQGPPGLRVSEKAFSVGRRFPIVQKWV